MPCVEVYRPFRPELICPVFPQRRAVLGRSLRARVNHETFYFSSEEARREFELHPLRYCGTVTDPVSSERFRPTAASPRTDYSGRPYCFVSGDTLAEFRRSPSSYADAKRQMPERERQLPPAPGL